MKQLWWWVRRNWKTILRIIGAFAATIFFLCYAIARFLAIVSLIGY